MKSKDPVCSMKKPTKDACINDFAIRCFRDTADEDYITARMTFHGRLFREFLWASEQAIEKYLKCILMLNRRKANFGHDIAKGLSQVNAELPFKIKLTSWEQSVFERIASNDADRYLAVSYAVEGTDLPRLDCLVWRLRKYCQPLDVEDIFSTPSEQTLKNNLHRIEAELLDSQTPIQKAALQGGLLEAIASDKEHPARVHLLRNNPRFVTRRRKTVMVSNTIKGENSPLWLSPGLLDEVCQFMYIPPRYIRHYKEVARTEQDN